MTWNRWISALGLLSLAIAWTGCVGPQVNEKFSCVDDVIRIGDTLAISLIIPTGVDPTAPASDKQYLVGSDETVNLYLLGPVKAAGKKFAEFEKEVQMNYIQKNFFRSNQITVVVKPDQRFYSVGGEVYQKGRQLYIGKTTVLRAIASCGDFTEFANRRKVEITRADGRREIMDCKAALRDPRLDRPICPGDHINVPRSL